MFKGKFLASLALCAAMILSMLSTVVLFQDTVLATQIDWSTVFKHSDAWFGSSEGIAFADQCVQYQLPDGGWRKDMMVATSGSWGKSTIDNDVTTSQIIVLAKTYNQTKNSKYLTACQKGIDLLLNGQYANGGWPQVFNDTGTYHAHITYNDGAMVHVLNLLTNVSKKSGDFSFIDSTRALKASTAIAKGIQCILDTQIISNGVRTAWCQQHDESTLKPAGARAYELPSTSASESVGIVNYLKSLSSPSADVVNSINTAIAWMKKVQILGIKVVDTGDDKVVVSDSSAPPIWARFYELGTDKPMFVDRDGSIHYKLSEISLERRTGYAWYGDWPKGLVAAGSVSPKPTSTPTSTPTKPATAAPTATPTSKPAATPTPATSPSPAPESGYTIYQAENATSSQAVLEAKNTGYTGTGYVNYDAVVGSSIEWKVNVPASGNVRLNFRYANGSTFNRPLEIKVNGIAVASSLDFNITGAWTTWSIVSVDVKLNQGINTIKAAAVGAEGPNMDYVEVVEVQNVSPNYDLNGDKVINMADIMILASSFNRIKGEAEYVEAYDLNKDGAINMADILIISGKFNTSA